MNRKLLDWVGLRAAVRQIGGQSDDPHNWPDAAWALLIEHGIGNASVPGAGTESSVRIGIELAQLDLTVAFVWSQYQAAVQRIARGSTELRERWLPRFANSSNYATVGLSHLTTSRNRGPGPAVLAEPVDGGYRLNGTIPWVTGAAHAAVLVVGGTCADGRQLLAALEPRPGEVSSPVTQSLLALSGSQTVPVTLTNAFVPSDAVIAGPVEKVMAQAASGGGAGSLMTSALAVGHALGILHAWNLEPNLSSAAAAIGVRLKTIADDLRDELLAAVDQPAVDAAAYRLRSTRLALQVSQGFLTASQGAGFMTGHPAERMAREALFFLVWSCPQAVAGELLEGFATCEDP